MKNNNADIKSNDRKLSGGGYNLNDNVEESEERFTNLDRIMYGIPELSEDEEKEIDDMIKEVESTGFVEKCREIARQREKKVIRIGYLCINKAACMIFVICFSTVLIGGIAYAAVQKNIQSIQIKDMGDHSEVDLEYNDTTGLNLSKIEDYYKPAWIPDGYNIESEYMCDVYYNISYVDSFSSDMIYYSQYLPCAKYHYSTENGKSEKVKFGVYSGEYISTEHETYLIVTDGTYLYSIISGEKLNKETMIKMLSDY